MSTPTNSKSSVSSDFLVYILNNLEKSSIFHEDLFELFGAEDASRKGLVGKWDRGTNDFRTACWDWGVTGFRHIINLLYYIAKRDKRERYDQVEFDELYNEKIKYSDDVVEVLRKEKIIPGRLLAIYVLRYKKQFPALILEIEHIKWERGRKRALLLEFKPIKYFVLSPSVWNTLRQKTRTEKFWIDLLDVSSNERAIRGLLGKYSRMRQAIYGLIPLDRFAYDLLKASIFLLKDVEKEGSDGLISENQIFWEFFRIFTGAKQETALVTLKNDYRYEMGGIPINSLTRRSLTYAQEAGVPNVLCHLVLEKFGDKYLKMEFRGKNKISYREAKILGRAFPVHKIHGEENNRYADSDYDYILDLEPLGVNKKFLFALTTALWKKGHSPYEEIMQKWKELYFDLLSRHDEYRLVWYIAVDAMERTFFQDNEQHKNFRDLLDTLTKDVGEDFAQRVREECDIETIKKPQVTVVALFRSAPNAKNVKRELENLRKRYRETIFYKTLKELIS
jgi:hypothetical protein